MFLVPEKTQRGSCQGRRDPVPYLWGQFIFLSRGLGATITLPVRSAGFGLGGCQDRQCLGFVLAFLLHLNCPVSTSPFLFLKQVSWDIIHTHHTICIKVYNSVVLVESQIRATTTTVHFRPFSSPLKEISYTLVSTSPFFKRKIYLTVPGLSCGMQDLVPQLEIEPAPPALGAQSLFYVCVVGEHRVLTTRPPGKCFTTFFLSLHTPASREQTLICSLSLQISLFWNLT